MGVAFLLLNSVLLLLLLLLLTLVLLLLLLLQLAFRAALAAVDVCGIKVVDVAEGLGLGYSHDTGTNGC
jgi:hypothetical protein